MNTYDMIPLAGILLVCAAVAGGFLIEHGNLWLLIQPAEIVIICGSLGGAILTANPPRVLAAMGRALRAVVQKRRFTGEEYRETLRTLYLLFQYARKNGGAKLEDALDCPEDSTAFQGKSAVVRDAEVQDFVCDTLRMAVSGVVSPRELDRMLEYDVEVRGHELAVPANAFGTMGDTLPGLGIVAAVMGVLITMGSLGAPPKIIGEKVAVALIGTFLGIFLSYGFITPLAERISVLNDEEEHYYSALRAALVAHARGVTPRLAVEFARRLIPEDVRPEFHELEQIIRPGLTAVIRNH